MNSCIIVRIGTLGWIPMQPQYHCSISCIFFVGHCVQFCTVSDALINTEKVCIVSLAFTGCIYSYEHTRRSNSKNIVQKSKPKTRGKAAFSHYFDKCSPVLNLFINMHIFFSYPYDPNHCCFLVIMHFLFVLTFARNYSIFTAKQECNSILLLYR